MQQEERRRLLPPRAGHRGPHTAQHAEIDRIDYSEIDRGDPYVEPGKSDPTKYARPNATHQRAFITPGGRVAPHGLDDADTTTRHEIARQFDDLKRGEGGPFTQRSYKTRSLSWRD